MFFYLYFIFTRVLMFLKYNFIFNNSMNEYLFSIDKLNWVGCANKSIKKKSHSIL